MTLPALIELLEGAKAAPVEGGAPVAAADAPLRAALQQTVEHVLDGEFDSVESVRLHVIDQFIRVMWAHKVPPASMDRLVADIAPSLANDPGFCAQVDDMLALAAAHNG